LEALRVDYLNEQLLDMFEGKVVQTPIFSFKTGKPNSETAPYKLEPGGVIVVEGIHCLNDLLTPRVPENKKFKIFIAPFSQVNLNEGNFTSNNVNRLIRRIVRDFRSRGYSALDTLGRWESVRHGEDKFIFPFMSSSDLVYNTSLDYELNVLKSFCKPLLKSVKPGSPYYNLAQELLTFLSHFFAVSHDYVPATSILREFVGNSFFGTG
jgi:uridine kinase